MFLEKNVSLIPYKKFYSKFSLSNSWMETKLFELVTAQQWKCDSGNMLTTINTCEMDDRISQQILELWH